MSVGTFVTLMVLIESILLFIAVRWLMTGLRSAECREWPPVLPLPSSTVPTPRDAAVRSEEPVAVS